MTKNVTLLGASYPDVPSIILPQTGGGNAEFFADKAGWMGTNMELVYTSNLYEYALKDTDFPSWTPSNTATTIRTYQEDSRIAIDLENYEYCVLWKCESEVVYEDGYTPVAAAKHNTSIVAQQVYRRPGTLASILTEKFDKNTTTTSVGNIQTYYDANGDIASVYSNAYGIYISSQAAGFTNTSSTSPSLILRTQLVMARTGANTASAASMSHIDQEKTKIRQKGYLYRVGKDAFFRGLHEVTVDVFNNGIT